MAFSITVNGHTYTEADFAGYSVFTGLPAMIADLIADMAGKLAAALGYVGQAQSQALNAGASATAATNSANAAAASAATALTAPGTSATSATALTVGPGSKLLTIQTGKSISVTAKVTIARTSDPSGWWMHGPVTAHDPVTGALTINVERYVGTGTVSDWTVSISGPEGPQGIQGQSGVVVWQRVSTTSTLSAAPAKWLADTLAAPIDLTLDPALPDLSEIIIKDRKGTFGTNRCRMLPGTGRTIMGATFLDLTINYAEHRLVLDGTDWRV